VQDSRESNPGIEQNAENSILDGRMQAIQGNNNIQFQDESN
jgi:hypothetical protein